MLCKFVSDLGFHEVLQKITKENEELEKLEKYGQKPLKLCTNLYVCFVSVCVCGWGL